MATSRNQVATLDGEPGKPAQFVAMMETQKGELGKMLPPGLPPDKFVRTVKNALIRDPQLAEASGQSLFLECQKAAQDGLVLDGREAALVRFRSWDKATRGYVTNVVYIPMVAGIMKRARNSGEVRNWSVGVVYEHELAFDEELGKRRFVWTQGDNGRLEHEPILIGERGDVVAFYSHVRLADGSSSHEVMNVDEVNRIRARTRSKVNKGTKEKPDWEITGPWKDDYEEMGKKTVIHRHCKRLPMDSAAAERVEALYDFEDQDGIYRDPEAVPPSVRNKRNGSAAAKLAEAHEEPGEVEDRPHEEPSDDEPQDEDEINEDDAI